MVLVLKQLTFITFEISFRLILTNPLNLIQSSYFRNWIPSFITVSCSIVILLHYILSHFILLYSILFDCIVFNCVVFSCIELYCNGLDCFVLHCIALHCIALHCIVLYCVLSHLILFNCIVGCTWLWRSMMTQQRQPWSLLDRNRTWAAMHSLTQWYVRTSSHADVLFIV